MTVADNSQAGPEGGNPQVNPDELSLEDLLPEAEDDLPDEDGQDLEGGAEGDDADEDPDAENPDAEAKQLADDADYELPDGRKVKVAEMAKSFVDFTHKAQELATERQAVRADALQAIAQTRESQAQQMALVAQHIVQLVAPGVTDQALYQLAQQDPEAYFRQKAQLDAAQNFVAQVTQHSQALMQQAQQARQQAEQESGAAAQARLAEVSQVLSAQPWFTPDFGNKARAYMKTLGMPAEAIEAINMGQGGAAAIQIVRKAMLFDEAQKQRKTAKQPQAQTKLTPNAKPAQGLIGKAKKNTALYEAGRKGDKRAAGRWLSTNLPDA